MAFIYFLLFIGLLATVILIWAMNESRKQRSHDAKQ